MKKITSYNFDLKIYLELIEMDNLIDMAFELKGKLTDQEYLELNNKIMEVYKLKAIIVKENGDIKTPLVQQQEIYNDTSEDLAEWEVEDLNLEKDETLINI